MAMNGLAPKRSLRVVASTILRPADLSRARETGHEIDRARHCGLTIESAGLEAATYPVSGTWGYDSSPDPGGVELRRTQYHRVCRRPAVRDRWQGAARLSQRVGRAHRRGVISGRRPVLHRHAKPHWPSLAHDADHIEIKHAIGGAALGCVPAIEVAFRSLLVAREKKNVDARHTGLHSGPAATGPGYRAC